MRIAVGQAAAAPGDEPRNAAVLAELTAAARAERADLLVLPESCLSGYAPEVFAGPLPTPDTLEELLAPVRAAAGPLTVVLGAALDHGDRRTLSAVVVREGEVLVGYHKQHLVTEERAYFTPGTEGASLTVAGVSCGLSICYDGCFPEHARAVAEDGGRVYLNSAAYFVGGEHRRDLYYAARALDNGIFVAFSGLTGECAGQRFSGGSAIYDPEGRALVRMGEEPGVVVAEVDPAVAEQTRAAHSMWADHRGSLGPRKQLDK